LRREKRQAPGNGFTGRTLDGRREEAQDDAELSQGWIEFGVDGDEAEIARGGEVRMDGALRSGAATPAMATTASRVIWKLGVEEAAGADGEQAEGGKSDGVEGLRSR
jgi:hypothetical protein